jgi:hypothetical protein
MKKLLLLVLSMALLMSCSMKGLTPVEQASVIGSESAKTYIALYNTYNTLAGVLEGEKLETLKKVAPALNQAKKLLISYNDIVIAWRTAGGDEPITLIQNKTLLNSLLAEISTTLIGLM